MSRFDIDLPDEELPEEVQLIKNGWYRGKIGKTNVYSGYDKNNNLYLMLNIWVSITHPEFIELYGVEEIRLGYSPQMSLTEKGGLANVPGRDNAGFKKLLRITGLASKLYGEDEDEKEEIKSRLREGITEDTELVDYLKIYYTNLTGLMEGVDVMAEIDRRKNTRPGADNTMENFIKALARPEEE